MLPSAVGLSEGTGRFMKTLARYCMGCLYVPLLGLRLSCQAWDVSYSPLLGLRGLFHEYVPHALKGQPRLLDPMTAMQLRILLSEEMVRSQHGMLMRFCCKLGIFGNALLDLRAWSILLHVHGA